MEKYKQEVSTIITIISSLKFFSFSQVLEGLQIEEEGLTDYIRKKTKQPSDLVFSKTNNDPFDNVYTGTSHKNGQILKGYSSSNVGFNSQPKVSTTIGYKKNDNNSRDQELLSSTRSEENGGHKRKKRHQSRKNRKKFRYDDQIIPNCSKNIYLFNIISLTEIQNRISIRNCTIYFKKLRFTSSSRTST